jgi:glycerophosphoryl diester phosphodiesterase
MAEQLEPEFMICDYRKTEASGLPLGNQPWPGTWKWMLYEINEVDLALLYASNGLPFIETGDFGRLARQPEFRHDIRQAGLD